MSADRDQTRSISSEIRSYTYVEQTRKERELRMSFKKSFELL